MPELYLRLLDRVLTPVLLVLAIILLMVGHNSPGGGFIAGLVVAAAIQLQILSRGDKVIRRTLGPWLQPTISLGLLTAVTAAVLGLLEGVFFKGVWWEGHWGPITLELGTPMLFDVGVFLVVLAIVGSYLLSLTGQDDPNERQQPATRKGGRQ
ncbi:MAG: MnhB domain-containing protein [Caldilineaceae bacterium]|jgi:multicomponent Na+:H+ antiporter subunit B